MSAAVSPEQKNNERRQQARISYYLSKRKFTQLPASRTYYYVYVLYAVQYIHFSQHDCIIDLVYRHVHTNMIFMHIRCFLDPCRLIFYESTSLPNKCRRPLTAKQPWHFSNNTLGQPEAINNSLNIQPIWGN